MQRPDRTIKTKPAQVPNVLALCFKISADDQGVSKKPSNRKETKTCRKTHFRGNRDWQRENKNKQTNQLKCIFQKVTAFRKQKQSSS